MRAAVKYLSETAGPSGMVPNYLVFGTIPRIPVKKKDSIDQVEIIMVVDNAGKKTQA